MTEDAGPGGWGEGGGRRRHNPDGLLCDWLLTEGGRLSREPGTAGNDRQVRPPSLPSDPSPTSAWSARAAGLRAATGGGVLWTDRGVASIS